MKGSPEEIAFIEFCESLGIKIIDNDIREEEDENNTRNVQ